MFWIAGNYFASHFMMGGEKFDTVNPECFLFGENNDLNYLCNKPTPVSWNLYFSENGQAWIENRINIRIWIWLLRRVIHFNGCAVGPFCPMLLITESQWEGD